MYGEVFKMVFVGFVLYMIGMAIVEIIFQCFRSVKRKIQRKKIKELGIGFGNGEVKKPDKAGRCVPDAEAPAPAPLPFEPEEEEEYYE